MDKKQYLKEWRAKNKDKVKQYNSKYFEENKEEILKKRNEKEQITNYHADYLNQEIECLCGNFYKKSYYYVHRKKCLSYQNSIK